MRALKVTRRGARARRWMCVPTGSLAIAQRYVRMYQYVCKYTYVEWAFACCQYVYLGIYFVGAFLFRIVCSIEFDFGKMLYITGCSSGPEWQVVYKALPYNTVIFYHAIINLASSDTPRTIFTYSRNHTHIIIICAYTNLQTTRFTLLAGGGGSRSQPSQIPK